ncbi:MAG: protein kinase [Myxococcota bacterium]|nr:protein kinase [Myxococcota bacterium]
MARQCPRCATVYGDDMFFCGHDGAITIQEQDATDFDRRLGTQLGDYVLAARVADGAMGRVYEGRHIQSKQRVAVKVLHDEVARDQVAVERFKREHETAAEMDHPGIVKVIDFGETGDGSWFLTMEYLVGEELSRALTKSGPFPLPRLVRVICQLCDALDHAHSYGFIHRDLKPDNVFLGRGEQGDRAQGDEVKVLDFGSVKLQMETGAKLTAFGTTLGSPYYMSPEQAMGKLDVDQRTDVFAAAAIAWELATGKVAFEGANVAQILMKIVNEDPAPPSQLTRGLSASFDDAVLRGVKKDKLKRPPSAGELANEIVKSLGLPGNAGTYAKMPESEIAAALAQATPPAAQPFGAPAVSPNVAPPTAAPSANGGERSRKTVPTMEAAERPPTVPTQGSKAGIAIAAVAALVLLGGLIAFFMFR